MASGTVPKPNEIFSTTLASNTSVNYDDLTRLALIVARRGINYFVGLVDIWNTDAITISSAGNILTITHEALSSTITIKNITSNSLPIMIIGF